MGKPTKRKTVILIAVLLIAVFAGTSVLIGAVLFQNQSRTAYRGTVLPEDLLPGETCSLYGRRNGGFVLVSSSKTETCVTFLTRSGETEETGENAPRTFSGKTERTVLSGNNLYLLGTDSDGSRFLGQIPLGGASLSQMKLTAFSDPSKLDADSLCAVEENQKTVFYTVAKRSHQIVRFTWETVSEPETVTLSKQIVPEKMAVTGNTVLLEGRESEGAEIRLWKGALQNGEIRSLSQWGDALPHFPLTILQNRWVVDGKRNLYRITESSLQQTEASLSQRFFCACDSGNIAAAYGRTVQLFSGTDLTKPLASQELDEEILALCSSGSNLAVLTRETSSAVCRFTLLEEDSLEQTPEESSQASDVESGAVPVHSEDESSEAAPSDDPSSGSASSPENDSSRETDETGEETMEKRITSDLYVIDPVTRRVELPPGTTLAAFKKTLSPLQREALTAYDADGKVLDSGALGTGCELKLRQGSTVLDTVSVIVYGDLNGNGLVNTADVRMLFQHLTGKAPLKGLRCTAADLDRDDVVDTRDLLLLQSQ